MEHKDKIVYSGLCNRACFRIMPIVKPFTAKPNSAKVAYKITRNQRSNSFAKRSVGVGISLISFMDRAVDVVTETKQSFRYTFVLNLRSS